MFSPINSKIMLSLSLAFLCSFALSGGFANAESPDTFERTQSVKSSLSAKPLAVKPLLAAKVPMTAKSSFSAKHTPNKVAWCHAVVDQQFPENPVSGTVGGKPFRPDVVQWNSYSITLKQSKKRYCKVVVNMMKSQKPLCKISFTSDSNDKPHIYVYTRSSNSEPVVEHHYTSKDHYGLKFALASLAPDDSVPGSLSLRLPDGSFVAGQFSAEKAPRVIWDDQAMTP